MRARNKKIVILIFIMLAMIVASAIWLLHIVRENEIGKRRDLAVNAKTSIAEASKEVSAIVSDIDEMSVADHIYSHRGVAGSYEHSFRAYDEAIQAGSKYIEQDLVLSSDGVLFVAHDLNASAMTGVKAAYASMSAEEIDKLTTRAGEKVLRLSEVFDKYGRELNYVIELKTADSAMINAFEEIIDSYDYQEIVIVQCRYPDALKTIEERYPDMKKLYVCRTQGEVNESLGMDYVDIVSVRYDSGLMTESNCKAVHDSGKLFSAWTLSYESSIKQAIDMGVDTYFTNDTALAMSLEREYGLKVRK